MGRLQYPVCSGIDVFSGTSLSLKDALNPAHIRRIRLICRFFRAVIFFPSSFPSANARRLATCGRASRTQVSQNALVRENHHSYIIVKHRPKAKIPITRTRYLANLGRNVIAHIANIKATEPATNRALFNKASMSRFLMIKSC